MASSSSSNKKPDDEQDEATVAIVNLTYKFLQQTGGEAENFIANLPSMNVLRSLSSVQSFDKIFKGADPSLKAPFDGPWKMDQETGELTLAHSTNYSLDLNQEPLISAGTSDTDVEIDNSPDKEVPGTVIVANPEDLDVETDMSILASQIKRPAHMEWDMSKAKKSKERATEEED